MSIDRYNNNPNKLKQVSIATVLFFSTLLPIVPASARVDPNMVGISDKQVDILKSKECWIDGSSKKGGVDTICTTLGIQRLDKEVSDNEFVVVQVKDDNGFREFPLGDGVGTGGKNDNLDIQKPNPGIKVRNDIITLFAVGKTIQLTLCSTNPNIAVPYPEDGKMTRTLTTDSSAVIVEVQISKKKCDDISQPSDTLIADR